MKRNCNGCRALAGEMCSLGYKKGISKQFDFVVTEYKPLEECPKPKTYDALMVAPRKD